MPMAMYETVVRTPSSHGVYLQVFTLPLNWTNLPKRMVQFNANGLYAIHTQSRFKTSQFKSQVKTIINIQISTQILIFILMTHFSVSDTVVIYCRPA